MLNRNSKALLFVAAVGLLIVGAPFAGAAIGASVASNAVVGGLVGFVAGALALPVPFAIRATSEPPKGKDIGKSRLKRMGESLAGIYGVAAMLLGFKFPEKTKAAASPKIQQPQQGGDKSTLPGKGAVTAGFDETAKKADAPADSAPANSKRPAAPPAPQ